MSTSRVIGCVVLVLSILALLFGLRLVGCCLMVIVFICTSDFKRIRAVVLQNAKWKEFWKKFNENLKK